MVTNVDHEALALRLRQAYSGGVVAPLRDGLDPLDIEGSYAVQNANTRYWVEQGRRIVGRKAGLTAKAIQAQLKVDQPDFGTLFEDMQVPDGGSLRANQTIQPKVEAEIAFILGHDLPDVETTPEMVAAAISTVHAAIEIVDSRIADWEITFADTVADNGSAAYFVISEQGKSIAEVDVYSAGMVMEINGTIVSTGVGAAVLGNPLNAAAWLARTLAERGAPLKGGDILLAGALGPMVVLKPGDSVRAAIGGVGVVTFDFVEAA